MLWIVQILRKYPFLLLIIDPWFRIPTLIHIFLNINNIWTLVLWFVFVFLFVGFKARTHFCLSDSFFALLVHLEFLEVEDSIFRRFNELGSTFIVLRESIGHHTWELNVFQGISFPVLDLTKTRKVLILRPGRILLSSCLLVYRSRRRHFPLSLKVAQESRSFIHIECFDISEHPLVNLYGCSFYWLYRLWYNVFVSLFRWPYFLNDFHIQFVTTFVCIYD